MAKASTKTKKAAVSSTAITAYKAFDANWQCRGFQFEVGKTYAHDGPVKLCKSGFHACEAPLDCLNYYSIIDSKFAEVELGGVSDERENDTKRVGSTVSIKASLNIAGLVKAQVEWCKQNAENKSVAEGDYSTAASSGNSSKAASCGNSSKAASSGDYSTAASSGNYSKAASCGNSSTAASCGNYSTAASSGNYSTVSCDTNGFACVAGIDGRVKGNAGSALSLGYRDAQDRNRIAVAYVGEDGIKPDTWYKLNASGKFVEA